MFNCKSNHNSVGKVGFEPTVFLCNGFTDRRHSAIVTASPNLQATNVFSKPNLQCCTSTIVLGALSSHLVVLIYLVNSEQTPLCSVSMYLLSLTPKTLNGTAFVDSTGLEPALCLRSFLETPHDVNDNNSPGF